MSASFSVKGKSAIVTGAGSGINLCFTSLLLSKGCNVLLCDLGLRPEAKAVVDEYSAKSSDKPRAVFLQTDVTEWSQLSRMFLTAEKEFGDVDLVCPGAGVFEPHWSNFWIPPGTPQSKDDIEKSHYTSFEINATHPIRTTQLAISHFLSPPSGKKVSSSNPKRVVLVSSVAGHGGVLTAPLYIAAKHAVHGFTRSMGGLEDTLGIRVNAVAPGIIKTPLWTDHPEKMNVVNPEDIWVEPEEVAEVMLAMAEDKDMIGGTILEVGRSYTQKVPAVSFPEPRGQGMSVGNMAVGIEEVYGWLAKENWGKTT